MCVCKPVQAFMLSYQVKVSGNSLVQVQGAATEYLGSLPTKTPSHSGEALGDMSRCVLAWSPKIAPKQCEKLHWC